MKINVLIIDSDIEVSKQIKYALQDEHIHVYYAISVSDALQRFASQRYEMVIMDIVHSEVNGLELIQKLHTHSAVPIIVLSSNYSRTEELAALSAGADKYLGKPLDLERCLAHTQTIMRRYMHGADHGRSYILAYGGGLKINTQNRRVYWGEELVELSPTQYRLICSLTNHMGAVLTKAQMYASGWDAECEFNVDEAVKYQIKELRRKFGNAGAPKLIETVWGVGYQLTAEDIMQE